MHFHNCYAAIVIVVLLVMLAVVLYILYKHYRKPNNIAPLLHSSSSHGVQTNRKKMGLPDDPREHEFILIVLGSGNVGKTALVNWLKGSEFVEARTPTTRGS